MFSVNRPMNHNMKRETKAHRKFNQIFEISSICLYRKVTRKTLKTFGQNVMKKKTKIKRKHMNLNFQAV